MEDIAENMQEDFEQMFAEMTKNTKSDVDNKMEKSSKFIETEELQ